jgi:hypothetical protein
MRLRSILAAAAVVLLAVPATASAENPKTWRVTIDNLTGPPFASFGQPLSAPLVAVHSNQADMWSVGEPASETIRYIAEDGHPEFGLAALTGQPGYKSVAIHFLGTFPPFPGLIPIPIFPAVPGAPLPSSRTFQVESEGKYNRLSLAMMLGLTNDGFTGLDSVLLHGNGGVYYTSGYDAGTERNNETAAFLPNVSLVQFVRDPETNVIRHHPGLVGGGALIPAAHGWADPVARVTVTRVK